MAGTHAMVSKANEWEDEATRTEFLDAVKYVGTRPNLRLDESVQRRLFGLHTQATRGEPPKTMPADMPEEHWQVWAEVADLSAFQAMQEYIDTITRHVPEFLTTDGDDAEEGAQPASELPPGIMEQLAAAGFKQGGAQGSVVQVSDVFEAARSSAGLAGFLPGQRDAVDEEGLTPLIHAVDAEQDRAVEQLLEAGASPNCVDPQGQAPLHYAALLGSTELAQTLLAAGADPSLKDEDGASPADVARSEGHEDLAKILVAAAPSWGLA